MGAVFGLGGLLLMPVLAVTGSPLVASWQNGLVGAYMALVPMFAGYVLFGWGLAREAWGKGYATEGATAAIDWAFETQGWTEVIHTIEGANVNSQKVAQRLGSRILRQAVLPAPLNVAVDCWGQSREEWLARRR